jgi:hypothetical protein
MATESTDETALPSAAPAKNSGRFYVLIGFSLLFVILFIGASLFVKSEFKGGAPATKTTDAPKPVSEIAGHYVGFTTIQTGICSVGMHELVVDIDEEGTAKTTYAMHAGRVMSGRASPDGKLKMNVRDGDTSVHFDGLIKAGHIAGHTTVSGDQTCDINWDLSRD